MSTTSGVTGDNEIDARIAKHVGAVVEMLSMNRLEPNWVACAMEHRFALAEVAAYMAVFFDTSANMCRKLRRELFAPDSPINREP